MSGNDTLALLEIKRTYPASPERIFDALTQPQLMAKWFFGMEDGRAEVESDLRVGGQYRIRMFKPDGSGSECADYDPHGEYLEIDRPRKLVFTWISEGFVDYSVVTILLEPRGDETELILRHELPEAVVAPHREGWSACLSHLKRKGLV